MGKIRTQTVKSVVRVTLYFFLVLACLILPAQQVVHGQVRDAKTREPLIGAHVYSVENWRDGAITDAAGKFELQLTRSTDSLIVSFVGYEEQIVATDAVSEIMLRELTAYAGTVTVEAKSLVAEEFKYMEIGRMDMYKNPSAQADPILAVNMLPASTTVDESANISLRGSSPFETGIYLNSVPVYDAVRYAQLNGLGTFSIFSPTILKSVDVFPGNPPIELGNSTSGAIALTTDESIVEDPVNSVVVSLANVGVSREQPLGKSQSLKIFSNWQMSAPIKQLNPEALDEVNRFNSNDLGLYYYAALGTVNIKVLSYSILEGYETSLEHPSFEGPFTLGKRRNFTISTMDLPMLGGTLGIQNGLSFSEATFRYSSSDFEVAKRDLFAGMSFQRARGRFSGKAGFSYDARQSEVQGTFHTYDFALAENHPVDSVEGSNRVAVMDFYSYIKYLATDQLTLGAGIRKNVPSAQVPGYLSGQFNAVFSQDDWKITAGLGSYHKHGLEENSGSVFQSEAQQISLDIQYGRKSRLLSIGFFHKIGELQQQPYRATGVEMFAEHRFNANFHTSATITYLEAASDGEAYRYDPSYFVRHVFSYAPGRMWEFMTNLLVREGTVSSSVQQANFRPDLQVFEPVFVGSYERLPFYANLSLGVNKLFPVSENFNVIAFASVNNLLDRENVRGYSYNFNYTAQSDDLFSRRTAYLGVVLNF